MARARNPSAPLDRLIPVDLPGFTAARLGAVEHEDDARGAILLATRDPRGFDPAAEVALHTAVWGSAAIVHQSRWRGLAHIVATTYVGPFAGRRVLAGELRLGEVERRTAVVWFSDLRGFTSLSMDRSPEEVVRSINAMFSCVSDAVHREGGEVLKLIGDAVMAIFPFDRPDQAREAVAAARRAAHRATRELPEGLAIGVGLHCGEVAYGNVGAPDRLDFTIIGRTVNLASRMEGLTSRLGAPLLATAEVAAAEPGAWVLVGSFPVKGVTGEVEVFAPANPTA